MRPDTDRYFIDMASLVASRSTCVRRSVGCVLVDARNHVLATGYNGVPAGSIHCNEVEVARSGYENYLTFPHACSGANAPSGMKLDACLAVHAEQNAILQCRDAYAIAKAYVTAFPCDSCLKLMLNTSCKEIVYREPYGSNATRMTWIAAGRVARHFNGEPPMIQKDLVELFDDAMNEWRVVVACVCLNLCSARVARGIVLRILSQWPSPQSMATAGKDLERFMEPLGLQHRRAMYLRGLSDRWGLDDLGSLPGVGPYAIESVNVFCRGQLPEVVGDRKVAAWVEWRRGVKS